MDTYRADTSSCSNKHIHCFWCYQALVVIMVIKRYEIFATAFDKKGRVISKGVNDYRKSHPVMMSLAKSVGLEEKIYLHAEIRALLRARDTPVHTLQIERYDANGEPALAAPCPVCREGLKLFGVKKIRYSYPDGYKEEIL